jgi:hypothetical protein
VNGSTYEGEFEDDTIHGEGIHVWSDGRGYSGQWTQNSAGSFGTMRWSDGRSYQGEWHEGHMSGYGKFQWPDGHFYAGQWWTGRQHGTGVVRNSHGHERHCLWKNGEFVRWLSAPANEESGSTTEGWEEGTLSTPRPSPRSPRSTPRSSPNRGITPRRSAREASVCGEVLLTDGERQVILESPSRGPCKMPSDVPVDL